MMSRGSTASIQVLFGVSLSLAVLAGAPPRGAHEYQATGSVVFQEDFESGLGRWRIYGDGAAQIVDSGDPANGRALALVPQGDAYALIEGSERWGGMRLEGEVLFPSPRDSYLGVIYNFRRQHGRTDFGLVYIKGNDSYLQPNPHRDFNVGRALYDELRVPLRDRAAIRVGQWQRFAVEVVGRVCHFYVGDLETPQLTFSHFEQDSGLLGLQPRSVGGDVWVDNLTVTAIDGLSYSGPARPQVEYDAGRLLTTWEVLGPFMQTDDEIARSPAAPERRWAPFTTDARGGVVTGRVVDFHGPRTVAYFRTRAPRAANGPATLQISSVDDLALWVNGRFHWFIPRRSAAWHDFFRNPAHAGQSIPVPLLAGDNDLVFRVRGGVYASGGFYARVIDRDATQP